MAEPVKIEHPTVEERAARGKAARAVVPRSSHAEFTPMSGRDPVSMLVGQGANRVPELLPVRYGRMSGSPFAFYRGSALVMAADLSTTAVSGLTVQACGDAHLSNFGVFGSPERRLVFDINDFDETLPGPWEYDVKRLAASLEVAGRENGFTDAERTQCLLSGVRAYRTSMQQFAEMRNLDVWYARADVEQLLETVRRDDSKRIAKRVEKQIAKAKQHDHLRSFQKLITTEAGQPRFRSNPPVLVPVAELAADAVPVDQLTEKLRHALRQYRESLPTDRRHFLEQYRFVDLARKVVGVGSVGTRCWVALLLGRDEDDPLFLQFKEAGQSVLEGYVAPSEYANAGQRVVAGQQLMQATSSLMLGWMQIHGFDGRDRDFYVRQLQDWKGGVEVPTLAPAGMNRYAQLCGWTLARAHARSGDRIAIAAYLGKGDTFDRAIAAFSTAYADQNERDHAALVAAIAAGDVAAQTGI
jgi:uncharacterized protein (DUF2252 family)